MTSRTTNDLAYRSVGNATTWNRYILFGYHSYDHCFQFDTQWERMTKSETDTLQFIWESYRYVVSRKLEVPTITKRWAIDIAKPHLAQHRPKALQVDTTDPRNARRKYDESDLMDIDSSASSERPEGMDEKEWTTIQGKRERAPKETPLEAIDTPLPASPQRPPGKNNQQVPSQRNDNPQHNDDNIPKGNATDHTLATSTTEPTPHPNPFPKEAQKNGLKYIHLNDGTLRITVRWTPANYSEVSTDSDKWDYAATDTIHYILATAKDAILFPWMNGSDTQTIPSLELTPETLIGYLAPKITNIESLNMYVFSFRLCLAGGPGKWINNKDTQSNLKKHNVEVNVSNASSDSGDQISVAGYIFFKHPKFTQRNFYMSHLRRNIQENTPFFDIGYHQKTPTGQNIPHLTVRVGENHVGPLTEILSAYLDGSANTVFLGRLLLSKMSTAEVDAIFQTHADYMTKTRVHTMAPTIQNVDLIRKEYHEQGIIERSTREWAASLTDKMGNSLQCEADNGGDSRRAQLLVPVENLVQAQHAFKEYKERISTFNQREADFTTLVQTATPPQAIYVPTANVHNNLALIQKRSAYQVWEQAPDAIRSPDTAPLTGYRPPTLPPPAQLRPAPPSTPMFPTAPAAPKMDAAQIPTVLDDFPPLKSDKTNEVTQDQDYGGDETATTHSQMTKSLATTQNRFTEMEAAIRKATSRSHRSQERNRTCEQTHTHYSRTGSTNIG